MSSCLAPTDEQADDTAATDHGIGDVRMQPLPTAMEPEKKSLLVDIITK
jgi:hypothetical protein